MINSIINFFRAIYYAIYSLLFGKSLRRKYFQQRRKVTRLMFRFCTSDYERITCEDFCHQLNVFDKQMNRLNIDGCVFSINTMIGLRERIKDNEKLLIILNNLCIVHAVILRSFGVKAVFETPE